MATVDEIRAMLARVRVEKLYSRQPHEAIKCAREALRLADRGIWHALGCYRLAHLLMRLEPPEIEEADLLMARAAREPGLGPLPAIYRLALLGRRGAPANELEAGFDLARRRLRDLDMWSENMRYGDRSNDFINFVNDGAFNMLELATWFLGLPHKGLLGLGSASRGDGGAFEDLGLPSTWCLYTNLDDRKTMKYPDLLGRTEARELRDSASRSVYVFRLASEAEPLLLEGDAWVPASAGAGGRREHEVLALTLAGLARCDSAMRERLGFEDSADDKNAFNQLVFRARACVREKLGLVGNLVVHRSSRQPWRIDEAAAIIALVEDGALRG